MRSSLCLLEFGKGFQRRRRGLACLNGRRREECEFAKARGEFALRPFVSENGLDNGAEEIDLTDEAVRFV